MRGGGFGCVGRVVGKDGGDGLRKSCIERRAEDGTG